jgi:hypothetical protein
MTGTILSLALFYFFSGLVEGNKNTSTPVPDGTYHVLRLFQVLFVFVAVLFFPGLTVPRLFALAFTVLGGNALYNRTLVKVAQHSWFAVNNGKFTFGSITISYPLFFTGWTEWITCIAGFTAAEVLS